MLGLSIPSFAYRQPTALAARVNALFRSGEQGVWYDPSDIERYMGNLGPELVTNGTFDTNTTGWNALNSTLSVDSQRLKVSATTTGGAWQVITTVIGRRYSVTGRVEGLTAGDARVRASDGATYAGSILAESAVITGSGGTNVSFSFVANSASSTVYLRLASAADCFFDNISIRELTAIDTATLFQDASGTTPVTAVEQPVGLVLDKSKGLVLGPELVTNGFSSWYVIGGSWTLTSSSATGAAATGLIYAELQPISNGYYEISGVVRDYTGGNFSFSVSDGVQDSATVSANGTFSFRCFDYSPALINRAVYIRGSAFSGTITNLSIKVVYGNHAFQSTSASRPVLSARKNWLVGTETLATQTVTTKALPYVLSFWGTGTITLTGTSTAGPLVGNGADNRVYLEFTPTAGTLTVTVSGTVSKAQLEIANE
jgi:hypothetical protein